MRKQDDYALDVVIPCYNESEALPVNAPKIISYLCEQQKKRPRLRSFRVILVNDGSSDDTWEIIKRLAADHDVISGVKLSRNYGHQNAMLAGLHHATADVVLTMDADLQDDINAIEQMLNDYERGAAMVLGVRKSRTTDAGFKRRTARAFYALQSLMGIRVVADHADYRLMSRPALAALLSHNEVNLFLRGIIPTIGFKTTIVYYDRLARELGETKYTLRKMIGLALNGFTSFSVTPLRIISLLGLVTSVISIILAGWVLGVRIFESSAAVPGWASTALPILALGGLQLLSMGVMGEYIGKIYLEVKRRPRFIVEDVI